MWRNGGDYTPFSVSPAVSAIVYDETHAYAPPVRRFFANGRIPAEVDNYEKRAGRASVPLIPPLLVGVLARLVGSPENAFIAADCVFPALLFLLLFALAGGVNLTWRLLVAWSTLIVSFGILNSFWLGDHALIAPLEITRTPQPELSFLVLLGAAALFARSLRENTGWLWTLLAGIASAAVVYCYYFYTVAWGAALGFALLLGFLWRRPLLWQRSAITLAIMIALAIPYGLAGLHSTGQRDLLGHVGIFTREPRVFSLVIALLVAVALWRFGRNLRDPLCLVLLLLVLGAISGMNAHVLTGYETQPWHFWKRLAVPVAFFLVAEVAARYLEGIRRSRLLAVVALIALLVNSAARLCVAGYETAPYQRATDGRISLLKWASSHLPADRVLATVDPQLILLIPAITTDYTYVPSGIRSLTTTSEIVDRYYQIACLLGMTPADIENAAAVPNHLGHSTEVLHALGLTPNGEPAIFHEFVGDYRSAYARCGSPSYRVDYVIVGSDAEQHSLQRKFPNARELYRNAGFRLFDVGSNRPNGKSY